MLGKKVVFWGSYLLVVVSTQINGSTQNSSPMTNLSFERAIQLAQQHDPVVKKMRHQQMALTKHSEAASSLPDPKFSLSFANLPTDSFEFDQEPMTQFKVGYSQMFPQGDSLQLKRQQLSQLSQQFPFLRSDRQAKVKVVVGKLWLESFKASKSIELIESNRALFEQLNEIVRANYSTALGKTRQQDIVRAQLELTRLEDRLTQLNLHYEKHMSKMLSWFTNWENDTAVAFTGSNIHLSVQLPSVVLIEPHLVLSETDQHKLVAILNSHPAISAIDKKIQASKTNIELQQQKYRPGWGLNASYAYRDDSPFDQDRADFFSLGVTFEMPLFSSKRPDKQVAAAKANTSVVKTEKWHQLRLMLSEIESKYARLKRVEQRQSLFENRLLPQSRQLAEASLVAYTSDNGDFSEVVRARIAQLNAEIEAIAINVEKAQLILEINYYLVGHQYKKLASTALTQEKQ